MSEFLTKLSSESKKWVDEKILNNDQREKLLSRYGEKLSHYEKMESTGKINGVISILGAVLLGVGVLLLVAANWQDIPNIMRVLILLIATFSAFWAGARWTHENSEYPKTGFALVLLAHIMMGASIFLIAQIYHINANASSLLLLWFFALLPGLIVYKSGFITAGVITLAAFWIPLFLSELPSTDYEVNFIALYLVFAAICGGLGILFKRPSFESPRHVAQLASAITVLFCTYLLTFSGLVEELQQIDLPTYLPIGALSLLGALGAGLVLWKQDGKEEKKELLVCAGIFLLAWGSQITNPPADATAIMMNLVLLFFTVLTIVIGYQRREQLFVYLGLGTFAIHVITRYIDWFFDLLPRSLFFILGGILFIVLGVLLEKQRKTMISSLQ